MLLGCARAYVRYCTLRVAVTCIAHALAYVTQRARASTNDGHTWTYSIKAVHKPTGVYTHVIENFAQRSHAESPSRLRWAFLFHL